MADPDLVTLLRNDVKAFNAMKVKHAALRGADLHRADLREANLVRANLIDANLRRANLAGAVLSEAKLGGANLNKSDLRGALLTNSSLRAANIAEGDLRQSDLSGADLTMADLRGARLGGAKLRRSNLGWTDLTRTRLEGSDVCMATFEATIIVDVDLREVNGISEVKHAGPSTICRDTLARSRGQIPDVFLRGCGLSDWEATLARLHDPDLHPRAVEDMLYESFLHRSKGTSRGVFISYSHTDARFVDKIHKELYAEGASVWLDRHDLRAGDVNYQVHREIGRREIVLLVLSESSIQSDWVAHELDIARKRERATGLDLLCPVALDAKWKSVVFGTDSTPADPEWAHLKRKYVLDFSGWKTREFREAFRKLCDGFWTNYGQTPSEPPSPL